MVTQGKDIRLLCEVYLNDQGAMSTRMYDLPEGDLAFLVADGEATFENVFVRAPQ